MTRFLGKWFKIYEDEIKVFLWSTALLFLIRSSSIIFDNFAETAFLKRFGVEYLPIIYVVNSVATFVIMGMISGLMARHSGSRILAGTLVFCGISGAAFWFLIPLGLELIYPVLFVMKSLYEVLLGLLFWNLANDLFDTRQSKRIFPLITAGGVIGGILGSFGTPLMAQHWSIDNLLWVYLVTTVVGSLVVRRMAALFPVMNLGERKGEKGRKKTRLMDEFRQVMPLMRESALVKILVLLTLIPNVVIPILNYQFNFAIDQSFATEGKMIQFFGYFRGFLNIISFVILLFVGRVYGRWGLPVALMFHPFNYIVAFLGFLFNFNILSAMYARMSTNILRTTINNPARGVLMGLFPFEYRSILRPFLRGTVVRIGILVGSGVIMICEGFLHPRFLSIVGVGVTSIWVATTLVLKRRYSRILLDLISRNLLDMKSLEPGDVSRIFQNKGTRDQLAQTFLQSRGGACLWYARLLQSLGARDLDALILSVLPVQDEKTQKELLRMLSPAAGARAVPVLKGLMDPARPDLTKEVLRAAARMPRSDAARDFLKEAYESLGDPGLRAHAVAGLYAEDVEGTRKVIQGWLDSPDPDLFRAGVVAAGGAGDDAFLPRLQEILHASGDPAILSMVIEGLYQIAPPGVFGLVRPYLTHDHEAVRLAALQGVEVADQESLSAVIPLLGDREENIRERAFEKLSTAEVHNPELLIESLGIPNRQLRENIFSLLETLDITDVEFLRFARGQLERAYRNVIEVEAVRRLKAGAFRDLLVDHLLRKKRDRLETILRVLATQDRSRRMRLVWRGVFSSDSRQRSNAIEALDDSLGNGLSGLMLPILEDHDMDEILTKARKRFNLRVFSGKEKTLALHLLRKDDWVTVALTLRLIKENGFDSLDLEAVKPFLESENPPLRPRAREAPSGKEAKGSAGEKDMENVLKISIPDKILHLRAIQIFEGLSVAELAAIASVTEEKVSPAGEDIIREGESGETMFMIVSGRVLVIKGAGTEEEIELDRINAGDYFGEMALFEDEARSATIRALEETSLLVLHKREFEEIVREYPQIALHICRVLSHRLRRLHDRIRDQERG